MTDLLAECLNDVGQNQYDQLTNCSYDIAVLVEGIQKSFGERFTAYSGLPLELIDDLSIQNYEHARCVGTILFLDASQRDLVNIRVIPKKEVYFARMTYDRCENYWRVQGLEKIGMVCAFFRKDSLTA